ncbi:unnamed protein product [Leptidea sinapis]|uniref:Protein SERAC1 n=1 Tax=Leptidea sinapis TaxID=189913 RepID=A0A5E4R104_9NEOP|nr:unnamed protein product [Leptidea sinapis]
MDFPGARVISINYTSDPYLWRPLWRAEQMTSQLLDLGVGQRPIIWVGHSKGGLFIKQIYCEAYNAHLRLNENENGNTDDKLGEDYSKYTLVNSQDCNEEIFNNSDNELRSRLWNKSAGFMFYSVPHRGSPLADIKTPITARTGCSQPGRDLPDTHVRAVAEDCQRRLR